MDLNYSDRHKALQDEVRERISTWLAGREGWRVLGMTESPITGAAGNREFLIAAVLE